METPIKKSFSPKKLESGPASADNYVQAGQAVQSELENQGYTVNTKNYWQEGSNYKGVNMALTDPQGNKIELQFHTQESLDVKENANHALYEQYRVLSDAQKASAGGVALNDKMVANVANLETPVNIGSWGTPKIGKMTEL
jgi:diphthamide synthase (EF-2-diphthine--ammonia ligase)